MFRYIHKYTFSHISPDSTDLRYFDSELVYSRNGCGRLRYLWIKNGSILAVKKADILGRFAMRIIRYYVQEINSALFLFPPEWHFEGSSPSENRSF
jgi:hypothetical protein